MGVAARAAVGPADAKERGPREKREERSKGPAQDNKGGRQSKGGSWVGKDRNAPDNWGAGKRAPEDELGKNKSEEWHGHTWPRGGGWASWSGARWSSASWTSTSWSRANWGE
ncbi:unnamed protein product, partial [Prorocentrum cordatum]